MDIQAYLNLFPVQKVTDGNKTGVIVGLHRYSQRDADGFILHAKPLHATAMVLWEDGEFTTVDYLKESDLGIISSWQLVE